MKTQRALQTPGDPDRRRPLASFRKFDFAISPTSDSHKTDWSTPFKIFIQQPKTAGLIL